MYAIIYLSIVQYSLPIFGLDLPRILQYSDVNKKVSWGFETAREIDIRPLPFVESQQVSKLAEVILFLGTQTAGGAASLIAVRHALGRSCRLARKIEDIGSIPHQLLELVCSRSVICEQTTLVPPHGKMVD